ncbi:hypothetical protein AGMMS49938_13290 [Fibrobacterales bacterium]|nr:hypothetical protein AGMMS49938_13290 [Fibrobacterales bacterium]
MSMLHALELATNAIKNCRPNPAVGAVVMKNGIAIGEGFTKEVGKDHAEIVAIKNAIANNGGNLEGSELFVTLEPCSHFGRTPPCTDTIIKSGIKKVFYGFLDPNPQVEGKGIAKLNEAGIETILKTANGKTSDFYESYSWCVKNKTPFVTLKIAQTADGFIAGADKKRLKITGEESQIKLHELRSWCDAVIVGGGTFRTDNPQLTVRKVRGANPQKIIFSRENFNGGTFAENWHALINSLAQKGMHHILVEAGANLSQNLFLIPNSFQKFLLWTSPLRIENGLSWNSTLLPHNLTLTKTYSQGNDLCEEFSTSLDYRVSRVVARGQATR